MPLKTGSDRLPVDESRLGRAIFDVLKQAQARYLIVGGLAVVAHGYVRYTVDMDLVIALDPENVRRSMNALATLGYCPRVPVRLEDFANAELREQRIREKGMVVFQLVSDSHRETPVDVFVTSPFDFEAQVDRAVWLPLLGGERSSGPGIEPAPVDEKRSWSSQGPGRD